MVYTFTKMSNFGRPMWAAQHPDTVAVGFGSSKLKAVRQLEAGRVDRMNTIRTLMGNVPLDASGEWLAFKRVAV